MAIHPETICFGLDEATDRRSFDAFLRLVGQERLARILAERVTRDEIHDFVDTFTRLLKRYLSEEEYHRLFLSENDHPENHL